MKQDWHPDELARHWTLSSDERELLGNQTGANRLSFAVLLKISNWRGAFRIAARILPAALWPTSPV
jgi:hypothetical protein